MSGCVKRSRHAPRLAHVTTLLIVSSTALLSACARHGTEETARTVTELPTAPVVDVVRADLSNHLILTAEFEPFQEVEVMAKVSGYIREIHVDIGDRVRTGQLLATLDIPEMRNDLARAAAALDEASAELATARDELQRAESAHDMLHLSYHRIQDVSVREPGLVPGQDVDEAHSRDLVAEAQVSSAKSHITACEQRIRVSQAEQARVKTLAEYAVIAAPFTGVVTRRYANIGALIQAGTSSQTQAMPVVGLSENSLLRLGLPVPESAVPLIHLGGMVSVRVSALNRTFPGTVARFTDKVDRATRTMRTEVDVPNPALVLVPGMYAEVDVTTAHAPHALAVPVEAVEGAGDSARVFAVERSGAIRIVPVHLGIETAQLIEIRSGALMEGDRVIVGSRSGLKAGSQVQPKLISVSGGASPKS
jgi:RND family efflux transporter MFP subunit